MSCGKSIFHTEKCISEIPARYLQIWISPNILNTEPTYEIIQKEIKFGEVSINLKQNILIKSGYLNGLESFDLINAYLYIISGSIIIENIELFEGSSIVFENEKLCANFINSHIILFEF